MAHQKYFAPGEIFKDSKINIVCSPDE